MTRASARGTASSSVVRFGQAQDAFTDFEATLKALLASNGCRTVCEIGGGANPALSLDYIGAHNLRYCLLDVSEEELAKASSKYEKISADICKSDPPQGGPFDFVFSKMLAEHVQNPYLFHRNVRSLLEPGGVAFHFFPTLYALPFLANALLPERASAFALRMFSPRDSIMQRKFPAYYRWCRGPTTGHIRRFERLGYLVEEYVGFFGHGYYRRVPVIRTLHRFVTTYLVRHPVSLLTSFAYLVLRKTNPDGINA